MQTPSTAFHAYQKVSFPFETLFFCLQVCATIGLCDAPQLSTPARKLLAQTVAQAQLAQQQSMAPLTKLQPAQRPGNNLEDSTQCQICEMAVNYVKVHQKTTML